MTIYHQFTRCKIPRVSHPSPFEMYKSVPSESNSRESELASPQSPFKFSARSSMISSRMFMTLNVPEHGIRGISNTPSIESISTGWRTEMVIFISQPLLLCAVPIQTPKRESVFIRSSHQPDFSTDPYYGSAETSYPLGEED